jgi:hypothetical protein
MILISATFINSNNQSLDRDHIHGAPASPYSSPTLKPNQQTTLIAQSFAHNPHIIMLCSPTFSRINLIIIIA